MRIDEILQEGYAEVKRKFQKNPIYADDIKRGWDFITQFRDLVTRNQIRDPKERNIDYWGKQGYMEFRKFLDQFLGHRSETRVRRSTLQGTEIVLEETDHWLILIPLDHTASCFRGKNSEWCVSKPNPVHFDRYVHEQNTILIFFIDKHTGQRWAIAESKPLEDPLDDYQSQDFYTDDEAEYTFWDQSNNEIGLEEFQRQTGLDPIKYFDKAWTAENEQKISLTRDVHKHKFSRLRNLMANTLLVKRDLRIETLIEQLSDVNNALTYVSAIAGAAPQAFPPHLITLALQGNPNHMSSSVDFLKYVSNVKAQSLYTAIKAAPETASTFVAAYFLTHKPTEQMIKKLHELSKGIFTYNYIRLLSSQGKTTNFSLDLILDITKSNPVSANHIMEIQDLSDHELIQVLNLLAQQQHTWDIHSVHGYYKLIHAMYKRAYEWMPPHGDDLARAFLDAVKNSPIALEKFFKFLLSNAGPLSKNLVDYAVNISPIAGVKQNLIKQLAVFALDLNKRIPEYESLILSDPASKRIYDGVLNTPSFRGDA